MPHSKPKKGAYGSDESQEYGQFDLLHKLEQLERKIETISNGNTQRLMDELEIIRGNLHDLQVEQERLKADIRNIKEERSILVDELQEAWTKSGEIFVKDTNDRVHRFFPGDSVGDLNIKIAKQPQHAANKRQYMYRDRQSTERTSNNLPLYERSSTRSRTRNGVTNTDTQECREPPLQPRTSTPSENSDVNKEATQKTPKQKKLQELVSNEEERSHPPQKHTDKTPIGPLDHWVTTPTEGQRSETTKAKRHM
ncbi:hypothetical protein ElyMa_006733900 [Elysia marginata]|uniref:Uncharacterized protein n=1 Tax=Elysia marginata TaxID=1093978 RepID=A0AAV4IXL9_9GAST|nr:hypothetical protein ElyMa_006733900 [Elysia marginata]